MAADRLSHNPTSRVLATLRSASRIPALWEKTEENVKIRRVTEKREKIRKRGKIKIR
jgi:hypothetical protein